MHNPSHKDWQTLKHLLRYLKGSITLGLHLSHDPPLQLTAYSDANWASSKDDQAKYKTLANTTAEFTWLNFLLNKIQIKPQGTPILYCDNLGATYLSTNPFFHTKTKHIEIDFHFVRERVTAKQL
ncbi:unnamed protein product [Spirodela intermedia]|uniref:Uncharacterized protein n=1 Tax=Spirodela intermedia TaxID=51605 RepID=A0A7I8IS25_SPIIN|nr:unnamed protein product [Spirodela intermedia]CAA6660366.1 unnamed protein product [Spirodela intermedia]